MSAILLGERIRGFLLFTDTDGLRHAVRIGAVLALSDGDAAQDTTVLVLPGGRSVLIQTSLDEVLAWFP